MAAGDVADPGALKPRVFRPGLAFFAMVTCLLGALPVFVWIRGGQLHGSLLALELIGAAAAFANYVSFRVDARGVTRTHMLRKQLFVWEEMRAITEHEPPPGSRGGPPHWEVTGRRARVLFVVSITLARREEFFAMVEKQLAIRREARIESARAEREG